MRMCVHVHTFVRVCACAGARVCVRVCMVHAWCARACVHACVRAHGCMCVLICFLRRCRMQRTDMNCARPVDLAGGRGGANAHAQGPDVRRRELVTMASPGHRSKMITGTTGGSRGRILWTDITCPEPYSMLGPMPHWMMSISVCVCVGGGGSSNYPSIQAKNKLASFLQHTDSRGVVL